jgi:hypothetical protein
MNTKESKDKQGSFQLDPPVDGVKGRGKRMGKPDMNKKAVFLFLGGLFLVLMAIVVIRMTSGPDAPDSMQETPASPMAPPVEQDDAVVGDATLPTPEIQAPMSRDLPQPSVSDAEPEGETTPPSAASDPVAPEGEAQPVAPADPEPAQTQTAPTEEVAPPAPAPSIQPEAAPQAVEPPAAPAAPAPPVKKPAPATETADKNQLRNIKFRFIAEGRGVRLEVSTTKPLEHFKYFSLANPSRVVLDLLGSFKEHAPTMNVPSNQLITGVRIGKHDEKLRIVADIKGKPPKKVDVERVSETELTVIIEP